MQDNTALAPYSMARLREAYDSYMAAELGTLNATACDLKDAAEPLGWRLGVAGLKPWVEQKLGIR